MVSKITLVRPNETAKRRGKSMSSHYRDIDEGTFPPHIQIGSRTAASPDHKIDIMNAAQIAGKSKEELREIVNHLVAARKELLSQWLS